MTECGEAIPQIKAAVSAWDEYQQAALELEDLQVLVRQGRKADDEIAECQLGKTQVESAIRELDLSVCPVCGQAVESAAVFLVAAETEEE